MLGMLFLNSRQVKKSQDDETIGFKTPDLWRVEPGVRRKYDGMTFDRNYRGKDGAVKILGIGNKVVNLAIKQARESDSCLMTAKGLRRSLYVFRIIDRITDTGGAVRSVVAAITSGEAGNDELLRDWELVEEMNTISSLSGIKKAENSPQPAQVDFVDKEILRTTDIIASRLDELALPFKIPSCELLAVILPTPATLNEPIS
jgi:hypothetical protein